MTKEKKTGARGPKGSWGHPVPVVRKRGGLMAKAKQAAEEKNARYHKWEKGELFFLKFEAFRDMPFKDDAGKDQIFHQFRKLAEHPEDPTKFIDDGALISTSFFLVDWLMEKVTTDLKLDPTESLIIQIDYRGKKPHPDNPAKKVHDVEVTGFVANAEGSIGILTTFGKGKACSLAWPTEEIIGVTAEDHEDDIPF